ncbi:hypothetical protein Desor_5365 [Desulfosporosinus orientis DSM 765]|uniref:DUF5317 domain-containing protein n=1 Tax=Desulfosporosinus orientis (strain ATCC 19365 / DSM 765 / NCIMB 8382 / VKM B-1628 / Singapore I) TaxID=768706 RepID=G7WEC9_DESOD|nr:DUF5317 domain-containing protein [Desulfosporosinus orientis]AET70742.1 hypothetical protein Desor_5365 [Desulfosporosinus orientis DSM 765]
MLIESLLIALAVSKMCGGKLSRLGQLSLSEPWLVPVALIIQSGLYWAAVREVGLGTEWTSQFLSIGSYCLLLLFTYRNRACPGMRWIALGILLNTLVIAINGGVMPVDPMLLPEESREALLHGQGTHGLMTSMTCLPILADRFYINIFGLKQMFSIGDILIDIGVFLLVLRTMLTKQKNSLRTQCVK